MSVNFLSPAYMTMPRRQGRSIAVEHSFSFVHASTSLTEPLMDNFVSRSIFSLQLLYSFSYPALQYPRPRTEFHHSLYLCKCSVHPPPLMKPLVSSQIRSFHSKALCIPFQGDGALVLLDARDL